MAPYSVNMKKRSEKKEKKLLDWLNLKKLWKKKKLQQEMCSEDKDAKAQCTAVVQIHSYET